MTMRPPKNTEEQDRLLAERSKLTKIPTPELLAMHKAAAAEVKRLIQLDSVYREELVIRQNIADTEAKLAELKGAQKGGA